jgi:acyl carrier protein phosphodiesterase
MNPKLVLGESTLQWPKNVVMQVLFFKILQLLTSTKPILKDSFINYNQNKVV